MAKKAARKPSTPTPKSKITVYLADEVMAEAVRIGQLEFGPTVSVQHYAAAVLKRHLETFSAAEEQGALIEDSWGRQSIKEGFVPKQ